jgi:predicted acyltransferase
LFIFVLSGFLPRVLGLVRIKSTNAAGIAHYTSPFGWFYQHVCTPIFADDRNASLFYAITLIVFYWLVVYILDKKKVYIRV